MRRGFLTVIALALIAGLVFTSPNFADDEPCINQTLDGLVSLELPLDKSFAPALVNGSLGSVSEYCTNNTDGNFRNGSVILYYYNASVLDDNESDVEGHVLDDLTSTYHYRINQNDEDMIILENDADMCGIPPFLAGKGNGNGSLVLIGGENLNELESYVNSLNFLV